MNPGSEPGSKDMTNPLIQHPDVFGALLVIAVVITVLGLVYVGQETPRSYTSIRLRAALVFPYATLAYGTVKSLGPVGWLILVIIQFPIYALGIFTGICWENTRTVLVILSCSHGVAILLCLLLWVAAT